MAGRAVAPDPACAAVPQAPVPESSLPPWRWPLRPGLGSVLASALYLGLITALARASGVDLLLFPELAALTTVVIADPGHAWVRSPRLLVLTPCLTGMVGIVLSNLLPESPLAVVLVVTLSLLLIRALGSTVMPALSAGLLPLALGLHSWIYPLALLPGTLGLALLIGLRRRWPMWQPAAARPSPAPPLATAADQPAIPALPPLRLWLGPLALFLAGALLLVRLLGSPLVLYPPLLVLAWETLAHPQSCPWRGRLGAVLAATAIAAVAGLLLVRWLGPVPLATVLAVLLVAALLARLRLHCPPCFAVALLPFVIHAPTDAFPLHVLVGGGWLMVVTALTVRRGGRRGG